MSSKLTTIIGMAVLLTAAIALYALGAPAEMVGILVATALGGAGLTHRGVWNDKPTAKPPRKTLEPVSNFKGPRGDGGAGFIVIQLLPLVVIVGFIASLLIVGCGTLTLAKGHVQLEPLNGGKGVVVVVTAGDAEKARVEIAELAATIKVPGSLMCSTIRTVLASFSSDKVAVEKWIRANTKCAPSAIPTTRAPTPSREAAPPKRSRVYGIHVRARSSPSEDGSGSWLEKLARKNRKKRGRR